MNTPQKNEPTIEQAKEALIKLIRRQTMTADQHEAYQLCISVLYKNAAPKKADENTTN